MAACEAVGLKVRRQHPDKLEAAIKLEHDFGLPDIEDLLEGLNRARKAAAYGDSEFPEMDAEDIASEIESYVDAVEELLRG